MSIENIYVKNKRVGCLDDAGEIVRLRDNSNKILGWYNKTSNITYTSNGTFYAKGNLLMSLLRV